ncbi:hypothetical protein [uncultured Paludibaculum sp.]|uniref:hypothetical protein n=1 Tax=uncultured Paludibaculum sp. TaxID=1765020 RepID=UPI002AAAB174|nr:hypothetical protein [uncultured Paludibaculum sp.]
MANQPSTEPAPPRPQGGAATATAKRPVSERRLVANRANARKSTGPRTAEGKRRVARNACRHNLYAPLHGLPGDIGPRLYRQALEQTAGIAEPRFRALFVHRLMLRGHERRLVQLEGKLWAEALRVSGGAVPQASLWIRETQTTVLQALGRYHAWICVRIRAIQKEILPYLIDHEVPAPQRALPAIAGTILVAAAGSSRPIELTIAPASEDEPPAGALSIQGRADSGLSLLLRSQGKSSMVRPVPAPGAVKPPRPPSVPGLSIRAIQAKARAAKSAQTTPDAATNPIGQTANVAGNPSPRGTHPATASVPPPARQSTLAAETNPIAQIAAARPNAPKSNEQKNLPAHRARRDTSVGVRDVAEADPATKLVPGRPSKEVNTVWRPPDPDPRSPANPAAFNRSAAPVLHRLK